MCNRFTTHDPAKMDEAAARAIGREMWEAIKKRHPSYQLDLRFNVAPTHIVDTIALDADRQPDWVKMRWGLVQPDGRTQARPLLLTNARSETARKLGVFSRGVKQRRCLLFACGYYEWATVGTTKIPYYYQLSDERAFAFAAIWDPGHGEADPPSTALLTTTPNTVAAQHHDRMPVVLAEAERMQRWLGAEALSEAEYLDLVRPLPAEQLKYREVNRFVSSSRNEGPQCLAAPDVSSDNAQMTLL